LPRAARDWTAVLAFDLLDGEAERLDDWAARHGLAAATVSRGFARTFGVRPSVFRAEARARRAFAAVVESAAPLAAIAAAQGFADQAHMTRAVTALTGAPPGRWRSNGFKTALH
jgi:AraC-like DNA-binding protein